MSRNLEAALLAAALAACAAPAARPPPVQTYRLGLMRADYRDYRQGDICTAEPRWLAEELQAPLAIVNRFVKAASQDPDADWSDETLALVRDAAASGLAGLVDALASNLAAARTCPFASKPSLAASLEKGPAACDSARRILPEVPRLLEYVQARKARASWRSQQAARASHAALSCAGKDATAYYAARSCDGAQEWLFCDGARVAQAPGKAPEWTPALAPDPPPTRKKGRKSRVPAGPEDYLAAAKAFQEVDACPALPARPSFP